MLKLFKKTEELITELGWELDTYEDEMQEDGRVEIEYFSGPYAKKGFDYDLNIRVYSDEDDEAVNFHYFSATIDSEELAESNINKIEELLKEKNITFTRTSK